MKTYRLDLMSPIGKLYLIANDRELLSLTFDQNRDACHLRLGILAPEEQENAILGHAKRELREYFEGRRREFTVPIGLQGTEFQRKAWAALRNIPFGTTISYRDQARELGQEAAVRATGSANGRNPIAIIVPCHRVVRSDGTLGGYAGGLDIKAGLLELEARFPHR